MMNTVFDKMADKIAHMFSTAGGWLLALAVGFVDFLGGEGTSFLVVGIAVLLDLVWGIAAAVKRGEYIFSEAARETFTKLFAYGSVLVAVLLIERLTHGGTFLATRVLCIIAASCELWSVCANILIVKPGFPFVRLFRKYLAGEISKKLNISTEEYDAMMQVRRERKREEKQKKQEEK